MKAWFYRSADSVSLYVGAITIALSLAAAGCSYLHLDALTLTLSVLTAVFALIALLAGMASTQNHAAEISSLRESNEQTLNLTMAAYDMATAANPYGF